MKQESQRWLLAAFGATLLLAAALGVIGLLQVGRINARAHTMYADDLIGSGQAAALVRDTLLDHQALQSFAHPEVAVNASEGETVRAGFEQRLAALDRRVDETLAAIQRSALDRVEEAAVANFRARWQAYKQRRDELVIPPARAGEEDAAEAAIAAEVGSRFVAVTDAVDVILQSKAISAQAENAANIATYKQSRAILIGATALALLCGAAIALALLQARRRSEERERLLRREQVARQAAEAANRAKDEFLSTLSHELRTPLTAIIGFTELARLELFDNPQVDHWLAAIERNAAVQNRLVGDLLESSRIMFGKLQLDLRRVSLLAVVTAAVDTVQQAAAAKQIRLRTALDPALDEVIGDQDRLQQVVWNLLANAVKFTPVGGCIDLRLSREAGAACLEVADTGIGIAPAFLAQVFDRFKQADGSEARAHGGLGLGLAIARSLVELHGGRIEADSAGEGAGATFRVRLPLADVAPTPAALPPDARQAPCPPARAALAGCCLLVVEDEADTRELLRLILEGAGAEVMTADSAAAAYRLLEVTLPDVLISDLGMPEEDGYTLIRTLRSRDHDRGGRLPALALTAYASREDGTRAVAAGFDQHLPKPVSSVALIGAVVALAGRD